MIGPKKYGGYQKEEVTELTEKLHQTLETEERSALAVELQQKILDEIISQVDTEKCRILKVSLVCTENALRERLEKDIRDGVRKEDVISRSLSYLPLYDKLDTMKIDVSEKSAEKIAEEIIRTADTL